MTKPKDGKHENKTHTLEDMRDENFMTSLMNAKQISVWLTCGVTIYLLLKRQYLFSLCGAALSICAATSERLKAMKIGLHGIQAVWRAHRSYGRKPHLLPKSD